MKTDPMAWRTAFDTKFSEGINSTPSSILLASLSMIVETAGSLSWMFCIKSIL